MARTVDIGVYCHSYDIMSYECVCAVHDVELQACHIYCCVQLTCRSGVLKMYLRIMKYWRIYVEVPHIVLIVLLKTKTLFSIKLFFLNFLRYKLVLISGITIF